jgi:Ca2+-binding RTX toxin-like protein
MATPIFILAGQSNAARLSNEIESALTAAFGRQGYILVRVYESGAPLTVARGGYDDWATASELPDLLVDKTSAALRDNSGTYVANMIWLQGEGDTRGTGAPEVYVEAFLDLIATFKAGVGNAAAFANFGVTLSNLSDNAPEAKARADWTAIQSALTSLGSQKGWITTVDVDRLAKTAGTSAANMFSDGLHYSDPFSQILADALVQTAKGAGNSTYVISTGSETIVEQASGGWDRVFSSISVSLGSHSQFLETLTLTGSSNISGTGNSQNNVIIGNAGNNLLDGASGNDNLVGGAGNDTFQDAAGSDRMLGGQGSDVYYVDSAGDSVTELAAEGWDRVFSSVSVSLRDHSQHLEALTLAGSDNLTGTGNWQANRIEGNTGNNVLNGAYGDDVLIGGAGDDVFQDDIGADRMLGGKGNDIYYVDNAGDQIVELAGEGIDQVFASISIELRSFGHEVEHLTLTGGKNLNGTGNAADNRLLGNTGNNQLNGAWGNDTVFGGPGDDELLDYHGSNHLYGGRGADVFKFRDGASTNTIHDFQTGTLGEKIDLSQISGIQSYSDLTQNHLGSAGNAARITDGAGFVLTIAGIEPAKLSADDFMF